MSDIWLPLESNPDMMNIYLENLGVESSWKIHDVYGLGTEELNWIPKPILAIIFLYPITEDTEKIDKERIENRETQEISPKVFFLKQFVHNACGSIAILHSILNNLDSITLNDGPLKNFYEKVRDKTPVERGNELHCLSNEHQNAALEGQTDANEAVNNVIHHFIAYVNVDGHLYELDGRKESPINCGETSSESFAEDCIKVIKKFIDSNPEEVRFTLIALAKGSS